MSCDMSIHGYHKVIEQCLRIAKEGNFEVASDQLLELAKFCGGHDNPLAVAVMKALVHIHVDWAFASKDRNQLHTARVCAHQMAAMAGRLGDHALQRDSKKALASVSKAEQNKIFAVQRSFRIKDSVRLHSLVARADLNGSQATVLGVARNGFEHILGRILPVIHFSRPALNVLLSLLHRHISLRVFTGQLCLVLVVGCGYIARNLEYYNA